MNATEQAIVSDLVKKAKADAILAVFRTMGLAESSSATPAAFLAVATSMLRMSARMYATIEAIESGERPGPAASVADLSEGPRAQHYWQGMLTALAKAPDEDAVNEALQALFGADAERIGAGGP